MKRLLFTCIILATALCSFADDVDVNGINYEIDLSTKTATINFAREDIKVIDIPSSITHNGVKLFVTTISDGAFHTLENLTTVMIPNSVTTIEEDAFYHCKNLTSVTIPSSVTSIGKTAFNECGITSIVIPKSLKHLEEMTFYKCPQLKSVTFKSSDIEVDKDAFWECENFKELIYAEGCTKIFAVIGTGGLTHVVLPSTATSIEKGAFAGEDITSIVIPASVTHIGDEAFSECESLKAVTMPNSVISIGKQAFYGCKALVSVSVSGGTTNSNNDGIGIGEFAFWRCSSLKTFAVPASIKRIGKSAFQDCTGLTSVTIPNPNVTIAQFAFGGCKSLTTVDVAQTATIENGAFVGCPEQLSGMSLAIYEKIEDNTRRLFSGTATPATTSTAVNLNNIFKVTSEKEDAAFAAPTSAMQGTWYMVDYLMSKSGWGYKDEYLEFKAGNTVVSWTQSPFDNTVWVGQVGTMTRTHQDITITFNAGVKRLVKGKSTAGMSEREKYNYNQTLQKLQTVQSREVWKCKLKILEKDYMLFTVSSVNGMYSGTDYKLVKQAQFEKLGLK